MPSRIPFGSIFDFSTFCWRKGFVLCALDGPVWYLGFSSLSQHQCCKFDKRIHFSQQTLNCSFVLPRQTPRTPDWARAPAPPQTKPSLARIQGSSGRPVCTALHVDITAFTHFGFFFWFVCLYVFVLLPVGMGKAFVCLMGGGVKIIIPNFLMYCFFFFCFFYTILSSDLRPPFGPTASWRLHIFCTLWWMLIGVFIIQSWMSFLVCSFPALIPFSYRHPQVSLKF